MRVDDQIDERLDPYLATQAATRLLKQNYDQLGSWPLALTAYNHGRTGVQRALNEMGSYENIFKSYNQGSFQFASRNFYSEFLAAMRVAKRMEGNPAVPFERPEATITFQLKETVPAAKLTANFHLAPEELARLNPALQDPILSGQRPVPKGYLLRLPLRGKQIAGGGRQAAPKVAAASIRQQPLRASPDRLPDANPRTALRYKVHKGDTSYSIARQHGITHQELMAANGRSGQAAIRIGETLIIPTRSNDPLDNKPILNRQPNS
jgi:membrane-bound lytic murein transglycosylase D